MSAILRGRAPASGRAPTVTVVVVSHNEGVRLRETVDNLLATLPAYSEIVVVDDASTDGSAAPLEARPDVRVLRPPERLGAPAARNFGARAGRGEVVVFSDAHVEMRRGAILGLATLLGDPAIGLAGPAVSDLGDRRRRGYGMTCTESLDVRWLGRGGGRPHPVPVLCGCFVAMRREVFQESGGFDDGLRQWGSEDTELCLRLWSLGYECVVDPGIEVAHLFRERHPYPVEPANVLHNILRVAAVHLSDERQASLRRSLAGDPSLDAALALLAAGDAAACRARLCARRSRDDDWFFGTLCASAVPA